MFESFKVIVTQIVHALIEDAILTMPIEMIHNSV